MKIEITEDKFNGLSNEVKAHFEKVNQFASDYLPIWRDTIVPGYHKDAEHATRVLYRLKDMPTSTGSEMGSGHWFHTLAGSILHVGEYLKDKNPPSDEHARAWGETVYNRTKELITWFNILNATKKQ